MRFETSCSKTLIRSDWRRFWPIAFLYAFFSFFAMPGALWNNGGAVGMDGYGETVTQAWQACHIYDTLPVFVGLNFALGVGLAMTLFGYLMNSRSVSLMHAMPVTRTRQFLSHFVAGLSMLTAVNILTFTLSMLLEAGMGALDLTPLLIWLLVTELVGFFFLAFGTLCAMATGWLLAVPVIYLGLNFVAMAYHGILSYMSSAFYIGHPGVEPPGHVVNWLTPVVKLTSELHEAHPNYEGYRAGEALFTYRPESLHAVLVYVALGAAMLVFAWVLYRARNSESAGDAIVFPWLRPVVKYVISVAAGLILGLAVYELFCGRGYRYVGASGLDAKGVAALSVCQIVMGILVYCGLEMLMRKSYKIFDRRTALGLVVLSLVLVGVCAAMKLDITGYQKRVPRPEDVARVMVSGNGFRLGSTSDKASIQAATELHRAVVREGGTDEDGEYFHVTYDLKDGSLLQRQYRVNLKDPEAYRALTTVINLPENQVLNPLPDRGAFGERFTEGYAINYGTGKEFALTAEQCMALYRAMEEDGKTPIKPEDLRAEKGWVYVTLTTDRGTYHTETLHSNCVHTIALLVEYGVMAPGEYYG